MVRSVARATEEDRERGYRIEHPNRQKAASKATKAIVILLLVGSAALVLIVTIGGWSLLAGAKALQAAYILLYLIIAFFVARWSRGTLPLAAALAIVLGIFSAVAGPAWFGRDKPGFAHAGLPSNVLGLITLILIPVQLLLIAFSLRAFQQAWNIEVEVPLEEDEDEPKRDRDPGRGSGRLDPAEA